MERNPTKNSWPLMPLPNYKVLNPGCVSYVWGRLHLTSGPVQKLETSKSNWRAREVADIKVDSFLPRCGIRKFLFPLPALTILPLILTPWRSLWFFCPPFSWPWPAKIIPLFTHLRPCKGGGNLTSKRLLDFPQYLCSSSPAHPKLLPDCQCLVSLGRAQPLSLMSQSLVKNPSPREICIQALSKESDTRQG